MNKAGDIPFMLTFHRNNIPTLPNGDDGFPKILGIGRRGNNFLQDVLDFGRLNPHVAANIRKLGTCIVCDFFFGKDSTENPVFQIFIGGQRGKQGIKDSIRIILGNITLDISGAAQHTGDLE